MIIILLGLLGVCLGSFINALVWRLYQQTRTKDKSQLRKLSITRGRSICPSCKHELYPYDLTPVVSWLLLKGRCRYCKNRISAQYPLVELATGLAFIFSYAAWPAHIAGIVWAQFVCWLLLLTVLIALAVYDLKHMLLPNRLVFFASMPVAAWIIVGSISDTSLRPLLEGIYGLVAFGGSFYLLYLISKGKWIGGGDVKLGFVLGAWLASPLLVALAIFLASFIGTIYFTAQSLRGRLTRHSKLPFGPLLIIGFYIAFMFGEQIITLYESVFIPI